MKGIIENKIVFISALIGLVGGSIWIYKSNWDMEPIILTLISLVEIIGNIALKIFGKEQSDNFNKKTNASKMKVVNKGKIKNQINIQNNSGDIQL
jgi:hypothetical protein